jgi:hypothetical protein
LAVRSPLAAAPLASAIATVLALIVDPGPLGSVPVLLTGVGALLVSLVGVVGMVMVGGRWALRLSRLSVGMSLVVAIIRPIDPWWWVLLVMAAVAGALLFLPALTGGVRKLPSAIGPPSRSVILSLLLVAAPFAVGVAAWGSSHPLTLIVGLSAPLVALWYTRVIFGGLLAVRVMWPAMALAMSPFQEPWPGVVTAMIALAVLALSWSPDVKTAFHPPRQTGSVFPIPPEMVPSEIRHAAGIDESGRSG